MSRDADGNMIFSDQPGKNSQTHKVKPLPTIPALKQAEKTEEEKEKEEEQPAELFSYTSLSIVTPQDQHNVPTGMAKPLEISGVLSPGLQPNHQIHLLDNGVSVKRGEQTHFVLQHLNRGEHQYQLVVKDKDDTVLIRSNKVTVYVQRHSTLNRSRRNNTSN